MDGSQIVVRADDADRSRLEADGWIVVARSWAAQLDSSHVDEDGLLLRVQRGSVHGQVREIADSDVTSVLALDAVTLSEYPGGIATQHTPLTMQTARATPYRRGFGVFDAGDRALAVTYVDLEGQCADTDFTVVAPAHRRLGLGAAVKALSILALIREGIAVFRTGGAAENAAIIAANTSLGYVIDEEWITFARPGTVASKSA